MSKLWYRKEAGNWNEALPVGNGFLGAMVFGKTVSERIQINEDSVWSGGFMYRVNPDAKENLEKVRRLLAMGDVREAEKLAQRSMYGSYPHMRHYQTLGDVWIEFTNMQGTHQLEFTEDHFTQLSFKEKEISRYERSLDLENGVGSVSYESGTARHKREYFASAPAKTIVYRIESEGDDGLELEIFATRKDNRSGRGSSYCDGIDILDNGTIALHGRQGGKDGIEFEMAVRVESVGGTQYTMGSHVVVEGAKEVVLYITGRTTYRSENPHVWCMETLEKAAEQSIDTLREEHINDYKKYFDASRLFLHTEQDLSEYSIPERLERMRQGNTDPGLINIYYDYARYLLISSSREHSLPANLQGIWNEEFSPSWGSKYTININIQMNYWIAEKTGLSVLHMPLLEHVRRMHANGREVAREMYGARGFCCHHNTDIWGDCAPQDNHTSSTIWPMGGAWLCLHLIEHYRYTKDRAFAEEYYDILRDSVLFFIDYMVKDENGCWVTGPSSSPENVYINQKNEFGCLCMGPTMDIEIVRELFEGFLEVSHELGQAEEIVGEVNSRLQQLPPLKIGKHGQIQEWQEDYEEIDRGHRHISQLFALYPGNQIHPQKTPELAEAAACTLRRRLECGGGHTGWSKAWIILFYARLNKAAQAWENLEELLKEATLDNLLDNHPPFQIDGNFGGAAGLLEMLIHDYTEQVYLLPALPPALKTGRITGICLKAGCILDLEWEDGKVKTIEILGQREGKIVFVMHNLEQKEVHFQKDEQRTIIL